MALDENKTNPLNTDNIGAVWEKQGKKGKYYTGIVAQQNVLMFKNNSKSDKAPAYVFIKPSSSEKVRQGDVENPTTV